MKIKYKPWAKGLMYLVEAVVIILSVFPILWVVMSSFKTNGEILSSPLALPAHFSLDTFIDIFQKYSFPTYFFNSLLAAGVSTLVSLLFLGGWLSPVGFLPDSIFWLFAKISSIIFFFYWIRATFPRFRYDQIMRLGWKVFIPVCLVWLLVVACWMMSPWSIWK